MSAIRIVRTAVSGIIYSIDKPYDYILPEQFGDVLPGTRVVVPFGKGNRRTEAIVLSVETSSVREKLKSVDSVLDDSPVLTAEQMKLALWMRERFFCTVYDAVRAMLPTGLWYREGQKPVSGKSIRMAELAIDGEDAVSIAAAKRLRAPVQANVLELLAVAGPLSVKEICDFTGAASAAVTALEKSGFVEIYHTQVYRSPVEQSEAPGEEICLTESQQVAFDGLKRLLSRGEAGAALLYGVTGSGKTAIYIKLIAESMEQKRGAIVLVPEIALTPQLVKIFSSYFGDKVAVLHSSLGTGERYDEWTRIRRGEVSVVVGTRSAVFAPVKDLGLIIIDEEQEHSFKSENTPRYHARDVAKYRCVQDGALLLLGSATPSIESMYNAKQGKYELFTLPDRFNEREMPQVFIADMRKELKESNPGSISSLLRGELEKNIARGEQSILFINRRGASHLVLCADCGYTFECPNCSVHSTYHSVNGRLICHYCGHSRPLPERCPECGGVLTHVGAGTQRVQEELHELFPDVRVLRMDMDTVSRKNSHEQILKEFHDKNVPILLGTQMVTKGLDFENVTLVGVLSADQSLYINDYRAGERSFSLMTQVVGRAGRGEKPGRAVIQTFTPSNEIVSLAAAQDYMGFYDREILARRIQDCPPFKELISIVVTGTDENAVRTGVKRMHSSLVYHLGDIEDIRIIGPAPAPVVRVKGRYRYRVSLACHYTKRIRDTVAHLLREFAADKANRGQNAFADLDPLE
ncbi:MAG: primosomal protein N' [Oscillospiraceae bacterium]|nr:primosomal protein N' [Oscillospiraceae bacterium]